MPLFLSRAQLYRLLKREEPEDVYADGAPSAFFTTAEQDSVAQVLATAQSNLERIYANFFPQSADEKLADWEMTAFARLAPSTLTTQQRRDSLVAKLRERPSISLWTVLTAVLEMLPAGTPVRIVPWAKSKAGWQLGVSELGIDTVLGPGPQPILPAPEDYCSNSADQDGQAWADWQNVAYGFDVRIYGYTLSAQQSILLDLLLRAKEPARSKHYVYDNLVLADEALTVAATDIGEFTTGFGAVYKDSGSSTGYSAWNLYAFSPPADVYHSAVYPNDGSGIIDFGNVLDTDGSSPFSFALRFKLSDLSADQFLLYKASSSGHGWYVYYLTSTGKVYVTFQGAGGYGADALEVEINGFVPVAGTWYHLAVTYSGSRTPAGILPYVNKVLHTKTTTQNNLSTSTSNAGSLLVGSSYGNILGLCGKLCQVVAAPVVWTLTQVETLFDQAFPNVPSPADFLSASFWCPVGPNPDTASVIRERNYGYTGAASNVTLSTDGP